MNNDFNPKANIHNLTEIKSDFDHKSTSTDLSRSDTHSLSTQRNGSLAMGEINALMAA
jgi:hypothetical protein